ncbi:hypothetical protein D3C78_1047280 [compost metagenome]
MNDPLAQPGEELRAIDGLGPIGFGHGVCVVDKHQIQVRTMSEFQPADLAVTDNHKARVTQGAVGALCFHLLLKVILGDARQALAQFGGQFRRQRWLKQPAFIEQLVEQQREASDLLGNPRTGRTQGQQSTQRARVFREQHQIRRAPRHRFNQRQHPLQHQVRIGVFHGLGQQTGDKGIETLAPQALHRSQLRTATQAGKRLERLGGIGKAALFQLTASGLLVLGFFPEWQPLTADYHFAFLAVLFIRVSDHLTKVPVDPAAPIHQLLMERRPIGEPQHKGNTRLVLLAVGEHLRLPVGNRLNRMLGVTQELIALAQFADDRRRQITLPLQRAKDF